MRAHALPPRDDTASGSGGAGVDIAVITTAALPWRTGPAFLSLWHACGMAATGVRVAYGIPWLSPASQRRLWGEVRFVAPEDHVHWLTAEARRIGAPPLPEVFFYRGAFSSALRGIVPVQDVFAAAPPARAVVLEEPEHLCWYPFTRPRARVAAERVIGVVMTNYGYYVGGSGWPGARHLARGVEAVHRRLLRRHTDAVIPLSPAVGLEDLDHPVLDARVTGVLAPYARVPPVAPTTRGVYFLGRLVWDKGLAAVIDLAARLNLPVDVFGDGPDAAAIARAADRRKAPLRFLGPLDAPWERLSAYRVFLNPSQSEVLCTATADALVAGRHVVLPDHPSNRPFLAYPNAHGYRTMEDATAALVRALETDPAPPTTIRHDFDWPTACRRLRDLCLG